MLAAELQGPQAGILVRVLFDGTHRYSCMNGVRFVFLRASPQGLASHPSVEQPAPVSPVVPWVAVSLADRDLVFQGPKRSLRAGLRRGRSSACASLQGLASAPSIEQTAPVSPAVSWHADSV